jgi:hypothetical protein
MSDTKHLTALLNSAEREIERLRAALEAAPEPAVDPVSSYPADDDYDDWYRTTRAGALL